MNCVEKMPQLKLHTACNSERCSATHISHNKKVFWFITFRTMRCIMLYEAEENRDTSTLLEPTFFLFLWLPYLVCSSKTLSAVMHITCCHSFWIAYTLACGYMITLTNKPSTVKGIFFYSAVNHLVHLGDVKNQSSSLQVPDLPLKPT